MASDTQYRVLGNGANLRTDPSLDAKIITVFSPGSILHVDTGRAIDMDSSGHHWYPVVIVHGWVRDDTVESIE